MKLPFEISPSTSYLVLHAEEDGDSYIEFEACNKADSTHGRVRINFERFLGGRQCYMSGEAGFGIGVVQNSQWLGEMNSNQKKYYPSSNGNFSTVKHYYFRGHDAAIEVLAENLNWIIINEFKP